MPRVTVPRTPPAPPDVPDRLALRPFRAWRYDPDRVGDLAAVTAPPYDVISEPDRERLLVSSPFNVVRLTLPEDERAPGDRYAAAARLLEEWRASGVLIPDRAPALYVYEQTTGGKGPDEPASGEVPHVQRGLVGALDLVPFDAGVVWPHENTMAGPVADRLALMEATEADLEPILLVYDGGGRTAEAVTGVDGRPPLLEVRTEDGVRHRIWPVRDQAVIAEIGDDLAARRAVIADGHHRYTTYLQRQQRQHAEGRGKGPWDQGLVMLLDSTRFGPQVHPIHRVIRGVRLDEAVRRASRTWRVSPLAVGDQADTGSTESILARLRDAGRDSVTFLLGDGERWVLLQSPDPDVVDAVLPTDRSPAWLGLDVSVAHHVLIRHDLGLPDDEETVGYAHDVAEAVEAARAQNGVALLLNATPVESVAAVAAAGDRMPRKSTLFTPKPRTGLLLRLLSS
jgi:uncharacterized protein (DUF1015 family)